MAGRVQRARQTFAPRKRYRVRGTWHRPSSLCLPPPASRRYPLLMARSFIIRSFAAAFAICFAFVTVHPAFADPCPVHEPAFANMATSGHHAHHAPSGHDSKSHHCTCTGCGDCVSAFALTAASITFAPAVSAGSDAHVPPAPIAPDARAEHSLPFSTAPPQTLIA